MTTSTHPFGATITGNGVQFRVWAPAAERVEVVVPGHDPVAMEPEGDGVFAALVPGISAGFRYRYRLDSDMLVPDPYARYLPDGVHGDCEIVDTTSFTWSDGGFPGLTMDRLSIYELHIGTYTPKGTFAALIDELPAIQDLGVTAIEIMPVAAFPGERGWGYDGVSLSAPVAAYGRPDDLRRLVDAAHRHGLGVILDVVYNHLGPEGNYLSLLSPDYFTDRHTTPWGDAINYDGPGSRFVRNWVIDSAEQWIRDYHIDGLRIDAADTIKDDSEIHVKRELGERVRAATTRSLVLIAEEAANEVTTIRPISAGGHGMDGVWADDFHHAMHVHLTGTQEHYYADYSGSMREICRAINEGFVYQGEKSPSSGERRGTKVTDEPASAFVLCLQNHDQVGNRPFGDRIHHEISLDRYATASALMLFLPHPVLLFMGQEFAASTPFLYFSNLGEELSDAITEGRRNEFSGFRGFSDPETIKSIPDPQAETTFLASKLDLSERQLNGRLYELYRALLAWRNAESLPDGADRANLRAEPHGAHMLSVVRSHGNERHLLVANFGHEATVDALPIADCSLELSTTEERFGGNGRMPSIKPIDNGAAIIMPARSAAIFTGVGRDGGRGSTDRPAAAGGD
jgi:maltooligosyltrehalose trehalohydrolase